MHSMRTLTGIWVILHMYSQILGHRVPRAVAVYVGALLQQIVANSVIVDNDVGHMQHLEEDKSALTRI